MEYKEKEQLSETYFNSRVTGRVVVAVEKVTEKLESEISLKELVQFLVKENVLKIETAKKLVDVMRTRNSVHLRQKTGHVCTVKQVDDALELLIYTITHAHRSLKR